MNYIQDYALLVMLICSFLLGFIWAGVRQRRELERTGLVWTSSITIADELSNLCNHVLENGVPGSDPALAVMQRARNHILATLAIVPANPQERAQLRCLRRGTHKLISAGEWEQVLSYRVEQAPQYDS